MKKSFPALLALAAALALGGCELFTSTVEYNVSGGSGFMAIRYQDKGVELVETTVSSPRSTSFDLWSKDRPFLAFLQVASGGAGATLYISVDGSVAASASLAASPTGEVFYIVE